MILFMLALTIAGTVFCVGAAILLASVQIHFEMFNRQVIKLCQAGNLERVLKLCGVAPRVAYCASTKAAIEAGMRLDWAEAAALRSEMEHAFQEAFDRRQGPAKLALGLSLVGFLLVLLGMGNALATNLAMPEPSYIVALAGLIAFVLRWRYAQRLKRAPQLFKAVSPELAACLAAGKHIR